MTGSFFPGLIVNHSCSRGPGGLRESLLVDGHFITCHPWGRGGTAQIAALDKGKMEALILGSGNTGLTLLGGSVI